MSSATILFNTLRVKNILLLFSDRQGQCLSFQASLPRFPPVVDRCKKKKVDFYSKVVFFFVFFFTKNIFTLHNILFWNPNCLFFNPLQTLIRLQVWVSESLYFATLLPINHISACMLKSTCTSISILLIWQLGLYAWSPSWNLNSAKKSTPTQLLTRVPFLIWQ